MSRAKPTWETCQRKLNRLHAQCKTIDMGNWRILENERRKGGSETSNYTLILTFALKEHKLLFLITVSEEEPENRTL